MSKPDIFGTQQPQGEYVSFEEMEQAFKTPTQNQDFYEPKPDPQPGNDDLGHLADPMGEAFSDFDRLPDENAPQVDHDHAMRTGERIARLIDTGIDFTLSNFVARNGESYRADERDLQDIAEAWGEVSEEHNWNIGPEWMLAILYIMVYGPLVKQAITDRRLADLEARMAAIEERQNTVAFTHEPAKPATDERPTTTDKPHNSPFTHQPAPEAPAQD